MNVNFSTVKRLMLKDWNLHQRLMTAYLGGAFMSIILMGYPHLWAFFMGCIVLISVIIAGGYHLLNATIIGEKTDGTTPFIISLPVRPIEYALSKLLVNLMTFLAFWLLVVVGIVLLALMTPMPAGLLPFLLVIAGALLMNYSLALSVALLTESEGWTVLTVISLNILLNPIIVLTSNNPQFNQYFEVDTVVWGSIAITMMVSMLTVMVLALVGTLAIQSRRTTFM